MLQMDKLLRPVARLMPSLVSARSIYHRTYGGKSLFYLAPNPRPYRRRLYDAAVRPVYPKELALRKEHLDANETYLYYPVKERDPEEFNEYELHKANEIKEWIEEEGMRFLIFCQLNSVDAESLWLASNQLRIRGFELQQYEWKTMRKLFSDTPVMALEPVMGSEHTAILFGKDIAHLKGIIDECRHYEWITPLVAIFEDRILPMEFVNELASRPSMEHLYVETVQLLESLSKQLVQTLERPTIDLCGKLEHITSRVRPEDSSQT